MSSTSCLAPLAPRLPCARVRLPPPSAAAERPSLRFKPRGATPTKGWRPVHISCFRQEQDVSTTSDDGTGFKYNEQAEISGDPDLKEEDCGSPDRDDQNYVNADWFVRAQKIKENLQETIFRFWNERWAVPWTGQTIAQVMFLWIATFWLVGSWIVPFLAHAAGFSKETLTRRYFTCVQLLGEKGKLNSRKYRAENYDTGAGWMPFYFAPILSTPIAIPVRHLQHGDSV